MSTPTIFSKTQSADVVLDASGNLTGITGINTSESLVGGVMKALANPFNGGKSLVVGAANLVAMPVSGLAVSFAREKIQDATGFDPFFGLVR